MPIGKRPTTPMRIVISPATRAVAAATIAIDKMGVTDTHRIALAHPDVQRHLAGQTPRRVIYVAGKLLNIVV